jgi:hypothetical protein
MGGYTRAVSGQRLGKHVPAATDAHATEERRFLRGPCQDVISKRQGLELSQFCTGVCEERTSASGRGLATVGAVTRKRLVTD